MPSVYSIGYWHQVRSNGYMNTAVSIWFSRISHFNSHDCPEAIPAPFPLGNVEVIWRYPGHGDFTQGNHDIYLIKTLLLSWADEETRINLTSFTKRFFLFDKTSSKWKLLRDDTRRRSKKVLEYGRAFFASSASVLINQTSGQSHYIP